MAFLFSKFLPSQSFLLLLIFLISPKCLESANNLRNSKASNSSITTIFVFGDSTVDPGNNNHIQTILKSDFSPYGVDYPNHIPTGRFCNGRLTTDFIAAYAGIKQTIPAYLDPTLSLDDLTTGVSFASAGSGYDPITSARTNVINLAKQLEYFDEYKERIKTTLGKKKLKKIMKHSVFIISCGTNDIFYTYGIVDSPVLSYTVPTYLHFLLDQSKRIIQALVDGGAERLAILGLPPVGCEPALITVHSSPLTPSRSCVEHLSAMAKDYNQMLQHELTRMQTSQPNIRLIYADFYTPIQDQINNPSKYGFEVVDKGCCGTGLLELAVLCNSISKTCDDHSKYMFWDSIHPTEKSYYFLFQSLRHVVDSLLHK